MEPRSDDDRRNLEASYNYVGLHALRPPPPVISSAAWLTPMAMHRDVAAAFVGIWSGDYTPRLTLCLNDTASRGQYGIEALF